MTGRRRFVGTLKFMFTGVEELRGRAIGGGAISKIQWVTGPSNFRTC